MNHLKPLSALVISGLLSIGGAQAAAIPVLAITLDGNLRDWGVTLADNNGSNLAKALGTSDSSPGCTAQNNFFRCEDTDDTSNSYQVTPHWGGQNYDVEFLGMARQANNLFFGIATGQRPDNGASLYSPGDLFLKVNGVQYVIEMGGGVAGNTDKTNTLSEGGSGYLYNINASGNTTSTVELTDQRAGSVWRVSQGVTKYGISTPGSDKSVQFDANDGQSAIGQALLRATLNSQTNQHAVWELSVDLSVFGLGAGEFYNIEDAHWGPSCYNDVLAISGSGYTVPEPGSLALLGAGLFGIIGLRRRKSAS